MTLGNLSKCFKSHGFRDLIEITEILLSLFFNAFLMKNERRNFGLANGLN